MSANPFCAPEESSAMLATLLENSDDAVFRTDLDGVIVGWSSGASRLYGYSSQEMIGSSAGVLIPDDKWDEFIHMLERIRAGTPMSQQETVRRANSGRLVAVLLSVIPVTDRSRRTTGALSIARDMTAYKQAESAYRSSDARWRAIIDSAVDGIVVIDSNGTIEIFNAAAERLFGYRAHEVVGRSVNLLMPPPYAYEHDRYLADYMAGASPKIIGIGREVTARRRNGDEFPARLAVGQASVDGAVHFTGVLHDLSDRVRMENLLREQTVLATFGEMSTVVAHEVRNALAAVSGTLQVIGTRLPEGGHDAVAVNEAIRRLDVLAKLASDMLIFANPPKPAFEPIDLGRLLTSIATSVRHDPIFKNIGVQVVGVGPTILGDAGLLRTAFLNLLTNGAQASKGSGTIQVSMETTATTCEIVVADDGPGVPPDVRDRMFTPFVTTKARGSGLGLAIAKRLVEAHGGQVRVESPIEGGARVAIELPLNKPAGRNQGPA